jgi:UDP-N-acetylmuramate dehydrogenase
MTEPGDITRRLRSELRGTIEERYPLAPETTYRIGGPADLAFFPADTEDLARVIDLARTLDAPLAVLGGGSNVLVSDRGVRGIVVLTRSLDRVTVRGSLLVAEAGAPSHQVALAASDAELSGAEFLAWLPGSVGGACYMNARAYGGEVSKVLTHAVAVDPSGALRELHLAPHQFGYKRSPFQEEQLVIAEITLSLVAGDVEQIRGRMDHIETERRAKHEMEFPSCGCVFRNDHRIGVSSGKLIESCGLKGFRIGDAQVSPYHANFIINLGRASASEVRRVMAYVGRTVAQQTGHLLLPEVQLLGEWEAESDEGANRPVFSP